MTSEILFDKKLSLNWNKIQEKRDFFSSLFSNLKDFDKDKISIIVLVISELLENIVKYTKNKTCFLTINFHKDKDNNILHITMENERSNEYDTEYYTLLDIVREINSYEDYDKMYMEFALKSIQDPNGKSRFGLALIRKLLEGNQIVIKEATRYPLGVRIELVANI